MNKKEIALLIMNFEILISTIIIVILGVIFGASSGQVGENIKGINYFKPYTIDSNILLGACSLALVINLIISIVKKRELNKHIFKLYYVGVVSITLTMVTVLIFLFPMELINNGIKKASFLLLKDMFFFHLLNPILAIVSIILMRNKFDLSNRDNHYAVIPMSIYAIVYYHFVAVFEKWDDFYGFTFGGKNYLIPIVLVVTICTTFLFGFIFRKINNKKMNNNI